MRSIDKPPQEGESGSPGEIKRQYLIIVEVVRVCVCVGMRHRRVVCMFQCIIFHVCVRRKVIIK